MNPAESNQKFWEFIRMFNGDGYTEQTPLKLGNVEFWQDFNGSWCYDLPNKNGILKHCQRI